VTLSATSENNSGVTRLIANLPFVVASCVRPQLRPLPSTGVTRLRQYYEPLRHPSQPGLSLASCQLIHTAITAGTSRVTSGLVCLHAVATTPAGPTEPVRSYRPVVISLPRASGGSAPASTFSRPAQRSLTLRPACSLSRHSDLFTSEASAASLPLPLLRLLPGGTNQFPGGTFTRSRPTSFHGALTRWFRFSLAVSDSFVCRCLTSWTMLPSSHPAHRTGYADFPLPALGERVTMSPTGDCSSAW
jgi:hypothetical protein